MDVKKFQELADKYYNPSQQIFPDQSYVFAVRELITKTDPKEAIDILGVDPYLDAKNYSKNFKNETGKYEKYFYLARFDDTEAPFIHNYLDNLGQRSRIKKRFVAARVYDEHFCERVENVFDEFEDNDTIYDLALDLRDDDNEQRPNQYYLREAIKDMILFYSHEDMINYLGPEATLDAWEYNKKIDDKEFGEFISYSEDYIYYGPFDSEKERKRKFFDAINDESRITLKHKIIAAKLQDEYFPIGELEKILKEREAGYYDDEDED